MGEHVPIISAVITGLIALLTLFYTKGSKARVAEMTAKAKLAAVDYEKLQVQHELEKKQMELQVQKQVESMDARLEIAEQKLKEITDQHIECIERAAKFEGKLEVLERQARITWEKVDKLQSSSGGQVDS